ncbi:MAG: hypothetical protein LBV04_05055 [Deferribacteraceae bacterium]|jgi:hypothetical protein|nr:hypothetical protein [Deferribacteraceae bacterium]
MKPLIVAFMLLFSIMAYAQQTTTVVVSGYGSSEEEAIKNAFVNAVESAIGAFISSSTYIENGGADQRRNTVSFQWFY